MRKDEESVINKKNKNIEKLCMREESLTLTVVFSLCAGKDEIVQ